MDFLFRVAHFVVDFLGCVALIVLFGMIIGVFLDRVNAPKENDYE